MIPISKGTFIAIVWFIVVLVAIRDRGNEELMNVGLNMGFILIFIIFPRIISIIFSWGVPEMMASDHGTPLSSDSVRLVLWMMYVLVGLGIIFEWTN